MDTNSGNPAKPRNLGLRITDSPYIAFIDSDDIWHPKKLEKQLSFMGQNQSSFSFTGFHIIDEQSTQVGTFNDIPTNLDATQYMTNTCLAPSTVMVKRGATTPHFPENKKTGEDFVAFYDLLKKTDANGLNEPLTFYRRSDDALSRNVVKCAWEQARTYAHLSKDVGIATAGFSYASYALKAFKKRRNNKASAVKGQKSTRHAPW
jgi:teichuronic acid biosynthesis glycosyltransferase TuaG